MGFKDSIHPIRKKIHHYFYDCKCIFLCFPGGLLRARRTFFLACAADFFLACGLCFGCSFAIMVSMETYPPIATKKG